MSYVILNPENGLYWSARKLRAVPGRFVSERNGAYTTYATEAQAISALGRTKALRGRNCTVVPEPAHERQMRIEQAIAKRNEDARNRKLPA